MLFPTHFNSTYTGCFVTFTWSCKSRSSTCSIAASTQLTQTSSYSATERTSAWRWQTSLTSWSQSGCWFGDYGWGMRNQTTSQARLWLDWNLYIYWHGLPYWVHYLSDSNHLNISYPESESSSSMQHFLHSSCFFRLFAEWQYKF